VSIQPFFADYLRILETMHDEFAKAVEGLSEEVVNWSPAEGMNSLAVLAVHTAGAERFWIGDIAMNDPLPRDRSGEFLTKGLSAEQAIARLQTSLSYAQAALERLTEADLSVTRTSPRDGRQVTVAWALLHALEHTSTHAGHAQLTRQLWEAQAARR
jgi:uncharacterized damage-inducible protein DinB